MTTDTDTVRETCTDALRKLGVVGQTETPTAQEMKDARRALGRLLKSWQNHGYLQFATTKQTVTLTTAASYTMSPVRPLMIHHVNFKRSGIETPMEQLTRQEYDSLPQKAATGTPTTWYYDKQRESALLYIWPVLSSASGETLEITYQRELADTDLDDPLDLPSEWYEAAVYGLAARLADDYSRNASNITARAERELDLCLAADQEGSVFFVDEAY